MNEKSKFLRIIDANFNRAKEALRVGEDLARFLLEDPRLSARFKLYRHRLTTLLMELPIPYRTLVESRNSKEDAGRHRSITDKKGRIHWQDLMLANLKRTEESLRVLEEVSKAVGVAQAKKFQALRFQIYELEKASLRKF